MWGHGQTEVQSLAVDDHEFEALGFEDCCDGHSELEVHLAGDSESSPWRVVETTVRDGAAARAPPTAPPRLLARPRRVTRARCCMCRGAGLPAVFHKLGGPRAPRLRKRHELAVRLDRRLVALAPLAQRPVRREPGVRDHGQLALLSSAFVLFVRERKASSRPCLARIHLVHPLPQYRYALSRRGRGADQHGDRNNARPAASRAKRGTAVPEGPSPSAHAFLPAVASQTVPLPDVALLLHGLAC